MVAAVSVVLFMVMLLIYFVVKNQAMARQLREYRHLANKAQKDTKFTLTTMDSLAEQVQRILLSQLESAHKRNLVKGDDYEKAKVIFSGFESVVMQCCEHGSTVEEAVLNSIRGTETTIEEINQFIAGLPSEVRLSWVKNQVGSYVMACSLINNHFMNPRANKKEEVTDQAKQAS